MQNARGSATPQDPLELTCHSTEHTCEPFLASFTHLSTGGVTGTSSAHHPLPRESEGGRDGAVERCRRRGEEQRSRELPADQAELVVDGGPVVGRQGDGELQPPGRVQFDSYLEHTDCSQLKKDLAAGVTLPGEVAEDPPAYTPSFRRRTQLELCTRPHLEPRPQSPRPNGQAQAEEVLPFCLDVSFDYDHVALSRKHPVL
ncbi:hypothetical protein SKAU_G00304760 [Synaphobranchus kaupii]|uniref:Uncharacterized protein n=1 Tax=Synaphobranchus kaupii TaxID=118154 RepID=A0A9Q1EWG0_SYNKA|nr:hypothetical protein SKAU_G00304760 [Synaphobranchus kaupii]